MIKKAFFSFILYNPRYRFILFGGERHFAPASLQSRRGVVCWRGEIGYSEWPWAMFVVHGGLMEASETMRS